jgi:hypothetical protein
MAGIPPEFPPELYGPGSLNLLMFWIFVGLLYVSSILFFRKAKRTDVPMAKNILISYGFFSIFYGLTRIFFNLAIMINYGNDYDFWISLGYAPGVVGFAMIITALEKIKYEKRIFAIIGWTLAVITIGGTFLTIFGQEELRETFLTIIWIGTPLAAVIIFILYYILIKNTVGTVRKKSIYSFLGMILLVVGIALDSEFFLKAGAVPLVLKIYGAPVIATIGWLVFLVVNLKE